MPLSTSPCLLPMRLLLAPRRPMLIGRLRQGAQPGALGHRDHLLLRLLPDAHQLGVEAQHLRVTLSMSIHKMLTYDVYVIYILCIIWNIYIRLYRCNRCTVVCMRRIDGLLQGHKAGAQRLQGAEAQLLGHLLQSLVSSLWTLSFLSL